MPLSAVSRFRIVYIVPGANFAGVEYVVHEIANWLVRERGDLLDVHVLYCSDFAALKTLQINYQLHVIPGLRLRNAFFALRQFFKMLNADMVIVAQCEMSTLCYLAGGAYAARSYFVPYLHGNPKIEREGSARGRFIFALYDALVSRRVSAMFAVSEALSEFARGGLARGRPVHYVPNPVRPLAGAQTHQPVSTVAPHFVNVARLSRQKGQDTLLRAFAKVRNELPDAILTIVGSGPDEEMLRDLAQELALGKSLRMVGHQIDPVPYLKSATCFVLPSRWEGFPLALTEALSFGLPVVVSDCDFGPREIVSNEMVGRVVSVDDALELATAMIAVARRSDSQEAIAMRREIAQRFVVERAAPKHFDVIRQVVAAAPTRGKERAALLLRGAP